MTFLCVCDFPECTVSVAESKSSGDLDPLSNVPASAGQTAGLDTQPLQSSASLDSSSVLPSPSTSFEPIKPDPTGSEYATCPRFTRGSKRGPHGVREKLLTPGK